MLEHVSSVRIDAVQTNKTTGPMYYNKLDHNAFVDVVFFVRVPCHPDVSSEIKAGMCLDGVNIFAV